MTSPFFLPAPAEKNCRLGRDLDTKQPYDPVAQISVLAAGVDSACQSGSLILFCCEASGLRELIGWVPLFRNIVTVWLGPV